MHYFKKAPPVVLRSLLVLALVAVVWFGCTDQSDRATAPSPQDVSAIAPPTVLSMANARVQEVAAIQERHTPDLLSRADVVGTGIGADIGGAPVILIMTKRGGVPDLPATIEGVRTRVEVVGEVVPLAFKGTYRPVPAGVSVGNANECAAGTIGAIVLKGGTRYMLSNNHVFARVNAASVGERINQPGRYDAKPACGQTEQVGSLAQFVNISFSGNNTVDAAIASLSQSSTCSMVNSLYTPSSTVVSPSVGLAVKKVGRTSGLTHGTISGINVAINVNYGVGVAHFVNQIYVASNFIRSGDSGSMMVTETGNNPVGLNFAGSGGQSFANPIGPVLQAFGASVCNQ
jgi:hypothetical protein